MTRDLLLIFAKLSASLLAMKAVSIKAAGAKSIGLTLKSGRRQAQRIYSGTSEIMKELIAGAL